MNTENSSKPKAGCRTSAPTAEYINLRVKLPPSSTEPLFEVMAAHINALRQWIELCGEIGIETEMEVA